MKHVVAFSVAFYFLSTTMQFHFQIYIAKHVGASRKCKITLKGDYIGGLLHIVFVRETHMQCGQWT